MHERTAVNARDALVQDALCSVSRRVSCLNGGRRLLLHVDLLTPRWAEHSASSFHLCLDAGLYGVVAMTSSQLAAAM